MRGGTMTERKRGVSRRRNFKLHHQSSSPIGWFVMINRTHIYDYPAPPHQSWRRAADRTEI